VKEADAGQRLQVGTLGCAEMSRPDCGHHIPRRHLFSEVLLYRGDYSGDLRGELRIAIPVVGHLGVALQGLGDGPGLDGGHLQTGIPNDLGILQVHDEGVGGAEDSRR
jgi:hypothetical protein